VDLIKFIADLKALKDAFSSGSASSILSAFGTLLTDISGIVGVFTGGSPPLMAADPHRAEAVALCKEVSDAATAHVQSGKMQAIGGGEIITLLLTDLPAILAFVSKLLGG